VSTRLGRRLAAATAALLGLSGLGYAAALVGTPTSPSPVGALGPGRVTVRLDIEHSRFSPARVRVRPHTIVEFRVVNHDPIGHELIIGDATVHALHESGTHATHPPLPGEVSVAPNTTATTSYGFHEPGTVLFACHLPGHFAYGMVGEVVVARS
jgi:plastocyanin